MAAGVIPAAFSSSPSRNKRLCCTGDTAQKRKQLSGLHADEFVMNRKGQPESLILLSDVKTLGSVVQTPKSKLLALGPVSSEPPPAVSCPAVASMPSAHE